MRETFRHEIPATAEKPETRVLEARALFDTYKRSAAEEEVKFKVPDLMKLNESFKGNPNFEKDREWLREQLVGRFDNQSVEVKLNILEHLADDSPELAGQLMEKSADRIGEEYIQRKRAANDRDAKWEAKNASTRLAQALDKTINKIYGQDRIQEIEEKIGYQNPLDETLRDREYKDVKVRITHLRAPEQKDISTVPLEDQWRDVTNFLEQVEVPTQVLERWTGDSIADRKHFLAEKTNQALATGIELIKQMPSEQQELAGKRLLELYKTAGSFLGKLQWHKGYSGDTHREVSLPFDRIDNPEIFKSFVQERSKQEGQERPKRGQKPEREEQETKQFEIDLEHRLAMTGIERDIPELVKDELGRIGSKIEGLKTTDIETLYTALEKRAETAEQYRPLADQLRASYHEYLDKKLPSPYSREEQALIESRLSDFLDPSQDWEKVAKTIEAIKKSNAPKQHSGSTEYFPDKLIEKCVKSLADLPEDQRKTRLSLLEDFCNQSLSSERYGYESSKRYGFFAEVLNQNGFREEAARYSGSKNLEGFIAKTLEEGNQTGVETLWKTKGWEPADVLSELASKAKKSGSPTLSAILSLADRYRTSFGQVERDRYVSEDAEKIEKQLESLITRAKSYGQEYIPPFTEEETNAVRGRINQYRSFSWELWQQGQIPSNKETRERVLKMFVEDGRDLAIAELGLGANQKIELFIAAGKVALEQKDDQALKRAIGDAKRLKVYEQSEEARKLVAGLEKDQEMLTLQTNVAEMSPERLRTLLDQSPYDKDKILNALIESGKYHNAITLCGELGQEKIARQLISKGALDIAEELIKTAPAKMLPNRKTLSAFVAYKKAGGELSSEKDIQINKLVGELPTLLRAQGVSEAEILNTVREYLSDDQRLIIDRCIETIGQEEFLRAVPSYEENTLKHFYLDSLFDRGKSEEAVRFAVLHEDGMLTHLVKRIAQTGSVKEIEPLLYKVTDLDTAFEVTNTLTEAGQKEIAKNFVKRFVGSLTNESTVFKNISIELRDGGRDTKNRAPEQEQVKNMTELKRLIFTSGSLESLAHIHSLFKNEENFKRFVEPVFEGLLQSETQLRELASLLSSLGPNGIEWYSKFLTERGTSKNVGSLIEAIETIIPRAEAMKRYPSVYATSIASSAKEAFVENIEGLSSQEKVQKFIDRYSPEDSRDTILLASISLDKQEWNKFLQALPGEERERAVMLADWYAAPRIEEQNLGPVIERAASRLIQAIESHDFETLRFSLDTLLSARTPEAASKLTRISQRHLEQGGSAGTTYRLVKTLSGMESFKANTVLSEIMAAQGTPEVLSRYLIRLLVENGHLDADLRGYFEEKRLADRSEDGEKLKDADRFRMLIQKYGINPDSSIMRYTDGHSSEEISSSLERMIEQVKTFEQNGEYEAFGEQLMGDLNMRLLYFLRNGGRTKFSLINDYNFAKFTNVLQMGNELEVHAEPFNTFEQTIKQRHDPEKAEQIIQRVKSGRFPLTSENKEAVFDCVVDANTESQTEQARSLVGNTLGRNEFGAFTRAIMYRSFIDQLPPERKTDEIENLWQSAGQDLGSLSVFLEYCESTFGSELENLNVPSVIEKNSSDDLPLRQSFSEEVLDVGITKIEPALTALGKKLVDNARKATQQKKSSKEERDRLIAGYQNPESVLPTLLANELPASFAPALDEWKSHVQAAIQASREARTMRRGESQVRQLNLRYLDKTASLPEYLRFADSAMCCFTSKNFQGTGPQQYIARIWKDPLSFVFHIEEPSDEQSDRRNSVGFVFGSYGMNREGEPVLVLNGVYMDKKTDLAARKVLQTIEQQLAKPLGCKEILTASQHAGRSNHGADYENTDREYLRLRAIKQKWNDEPEQHTYDDIGLVAVDAKEGRVQDSQVVNRWAKTGKHILRKTVS